MALWLHLYLGAVCPAHRHRLPQPHDRGNERGEPLWLAGGVVAKQRGDEVAAAREVEVRLPRRRAVEQRRPQAAVDLSVTEADWGGGSRTGK